MKTSADLFAAFLKCPTKCNFRSTGQIGSGNAYAEWVRAQHDAYQRETAKRLQGSVLGCAESTTPDIAQ
jgi:hypothetical protein